MDHAAINAVFKPKPSRQEAKADVTTRVAREILDAETAKRDAKTERLRLARMEQERNAPAPADAAAKGKAKPRLR